MTSKTAKTAKTATTSKTAGSTSSSSSAASTGSTGATASRPASLEARLALKRGDFALDVDFACGGVTVVMGPNAAGKTTLLRALLGAERPDRGRVALHGRVLFDAAERVDRPPEARAMAYVPQGYGLFPHLSVIDNVLFGTRSGDRVDRRARAERLLSDLGVRDLAERMPSTLSGGERQRVALARAMASGPSLLLLDEPLAALDAAVRPRVRRFLGEWLERTELPALLVTHDPADALAFADDLLVLEAGRIVQRGTPDAIAMRPATEFVAALTPGLITRRMESEPPRALWEDE